jgi:hypothetical protein
MRGNMARTWEAVILRGVTDPRCDYRNPLEGVAYCQRAILRQILKNAAFRAWRALFGYDVFISHSSRDSAYAAELEKRIRRAGFRVCRHSPATGDEDLEPGFAAARGSRMLVAIVTDDAVRSDRVRAEIEAFLSAPGVRRLVGIFFSASHPRLLPGSFSALKSYRGIHADPADLTPPVIRGTILEQIEGAFRAVRMSALRLIAAGLMVALIAVGYWLQADFRSNVEARDYWLRHYEAARAEKRHDLAEFAVARAAEAEPGSAGELVPIYREARARRFASPVFRSAVPRSYMLAHVGDGGMEPYLVYRDLDDGSLWLDAANQRTLIGKECGDAPRIASDEQILSFTCAGVWVSLDPAQPAQVRKQEPLPAQRGAGSALSTIAPGVNTWQPWTAARFDYQKAALGVDASWLSVFIDGQIAGRYPVFVKEPARLLVSPDGRFVAIQGADGVVVWQVGELGSGGMIPAVDLLREELNIEWVRGREPEYSVPSH